MATTTVTALRTSTAYNPDPNVAPPAFNAGEVDPIPSPPAATAGPKRCLQSVLVVGACLAVELNVFFLKYALWVPPSNPLNTGRLLLWLLVGPGILVMLGDNDAGGIITYAQTGAKFGLAFFPLFLLLLIPVAYVVQEMAVVPPGFFAFSARTVSRSA